MLHTQIKEDSTMALRAGDTKLLGVLKLLISELGYASVEQHAEVLADEVVVKVLMKESKKRKEAIEIYEKAGDSGRADQEKYELSVIESYLPKMMSDEEVLVVIEETNKSTGLTGGRLMGAVMGKLRGKVDGGVVNRLVSEKFPG